MQIVNLAYAVKKNKESVNQPISHTVNEQHGSDDKVSFLKEVDVILTKSDEADLF